MIEVVSTLSLAELRKRYDPQLVNKALKLANSKTAQKARTFIGKEVRKNYDIGQTSLNKNTTIKIKKHTDSSVLLFYQGRRLGLGHFGLQITDAIKGFEAFEDQIQRQRRLKRDGSYGEKIIRANRRKKKLASSGIRVRVKKKEGYKRVSTLFRYGISRFKRNDNLPFIARAGAMSRDGVFVRRTAKRLPIQQFTGPSYPQMISGAEVLNKALEFIGREHSAQFSHHLDKLLDGTIK